MTDLAQITCRGTRLPQAELAGLPPITGLYTSIMCLLGSAVLGLSRILELGPDSRSGR